MSVERVPVLFELLARWGQPMPIAQITVARALLDCAQALATAYGGSLACGGDRLGKRFRRPCRSH